MARKDSSRTDHPAPGACYRVTIERFGPGGVGEVAHGALSLRVPGVAPGDVVTATVDAVSAHHPHAWAHVSEVHSRGAGYRPSPCPHAAPDRGACGGCGLLHLTDGARAQARDGELRRSLAGIEGLPTPSPHPALRTHAHRNRGIFFVGRSSDGLALGARAARSGEWTPLLSCMALRPGVFEAASAALLTWQTFESPERLRYVISRVGYDGNALVEWVTRDATPPAASTARALVMSPAVHGVLWSVNDRDDNVIRAAPPQPLAGAVTVPLRVGDATFEVSTGSFAQVNDEVASAIVRRAGSWLGSVDTVWDLYGGIGTLGVPIAARTGARLFLAERDPEAVTIAERAALAAGVELHAIATDLSDGVPAAHSPSVMIVDPPRRGLDAAVLKAIDRVSCPVIYVSCSARSFARDARWLRERGWRCTKLESFDMMPGTAHVELLSYWQPPNR